MSDNALKQRLGQESHKFPAGSLRDSGPCRCEGDHCTAYIAVVNLFGKGHRCVLGPCKIDLFAIG